MREKGTRKDKARDGAKKTRSNRVGKMEIKKRKKQCKSRGKTKIRDKGKERKERELPRKERETPVQRGVAAKNETERAGDECEGRRSDDRRNIR